MTIVVSAGFPTFLVMASDSSVVNEFADGGREYTTGRKWWAMSGLGVVTMWGARDGNALRSHLDSLSLNPQAATVRDLAEAVLQYLVTQYRPGDHGIGDTGYHVGGFDRSGQPRLYHIFWNVAGSAGAFDSLGAYSLQDQSPVGNAARFLYNGRNDLADKVISALVGELRRGGPLNFGRTPPEIGRLCHFILRFGWELSPDVGPPFCLHFVTSTGNVERVCLDQTGPLPVGHFDDIWRKAVAG